MNEKERKNNLIKGALVIMALGICYLIFYRVTDIGIPWVLKLVTGYKCPGCGMTHAIAEITKGNIKRAVEYNPLSVSVLPVMCVYLIYRAYRYVKDKSDEFKKWEVALLVIVLLITVGYGILRNIPINNIF